MSSTLVPPCPLDMLCSWRYRCNHGIIDFFPLFVIFCNIVAYLSPLVGYNCILWRFTRTRMAFSQLSRECVSCALSSVQVFCNFLNDSESVACAKNPVLFLIIQFLSVSIHYKFFGDDLEFVCISRSKVLSNGLEYWSCVFD